MIPKYFLKNLPVGSGSIIGKSNIEEFLTHVGKHDAIEERSLAELAPDYETAMACLVQMLEARFISLNPFLQYMFLKLNEIEDGEKRDFILETLHRKFRNEAIVARKVLERFNKLGSSIVIGTPENRDELYLPIPCKLLGLHEANEKNFDWIVPVNLFDESSKPKRAEKGTSKISINSIQCLVEKTSSLDLEESSFEIT